MAKADAVPTTNSVITVTDLNTTVNCEPRVHDLRLAEALGFSDRHMIRPLIRRHMSVLRTFGEVIAERKKPSGSGGRPGTDYYLNKRQALFITAKSDTERAAHVTVQMVEVFDAVTSARAAPPPDPNANLPRRRGLPAPVTREMLETYASWLHMECAVLLEELHPGKPLWQRGVVLTNPGGAYHDGAPGTIVPPPSTRAEAVLRLVRCPIPSRPRLRLTDGRRTSPTRRGGG